MTDAQYKDCTAKIKALADIRPIAIDDADSIIHAFHRNIVHGQNRPVLLPNMSETEKKLLVEKEEEITDEPEKRALDKKVAEQADIERILNQARTAGVTV